MKKLSFLLLTLLFANTMSAQNPAWEWAQTAVGAGSNHRGTGFLTDSSGNVYLTGGIRGQATFGAVPVGAPPDTMSFFLAKFNPLGNAIWATIVENGNTEGLRIAFNGRDRIFVAGFLLSASTIFGNDTLINNSTPMGGWYLVDFFLVQYDTTGQVQWARSFGGSKQDQVLDIVVDAFGDIYITGETTSPAIVFGNDTIINALVGNPKYFLVKLDPEGNVLWSRTAVASESSRGLALTTDPVGNVIVAGTFTGEYAIFGTTVLINKDTSAAPANAPDVFIAKYDTHGNLLWVKSAGGMGEDHVNDITNDHADGFYITGFYQAPYARFGNITLPAAGIRNFYIARYDGSGNAIWATTAQGGTTERGRCLTRYTDGSVVVAGDFLGASITFGSTTLNNFSTGNKRSVFIAKYDTLGNVIWAEAFGGSEYETIWDITSFSSQSIFFTGEFSSPFIVFGSDTVMNQSSMSLFIAKLSETVGVSDSFSSSDSVRVFPNPAKNQFTIAIKEPSATGLFELFDIHGRRVVSQTVSGTEHLQIAEIPPGTYFWIVTTNKSRSSGKIVVIR
jgi:hypothetical protein